MAPRAQRVEADLQRIRSSFPRLCHSSGRDAHSPQDEEDDEDFGEESAEDTNKKNGEK